MDFKTYWTTMPVPRRKEFARRVGASPVYLNHYAFGAKKRLGEGLAIAIDRETNGIVSVEELRPDVDWAYLRGRKRIRTEALA